MHLIFSLAAALAVFSLSSQSIASAVPKADVSFPKHPPSITSVPEIPRLEERAGAKRPKYKRPPQSKNRPPIKHPKGCTNTELIKNGDFDKDLRGWNPFAGPGAAQFFWIKDSKQRPAHSGKGQAYLFLPRGPATIEILKDLPAVEYGNSITISMWMRQEAGVDLSQCSADWTVSGANNYLEMTENITTKWTRFEFEVPGAGREQRLRFFMRCDNLPIPAAIFLDDVSVKACLPRNPDPECQVLKNSDNLLVNPGFECPDAITAWQWRSNSGGNDSLVQAGPTRNNPIHSDKG